MPEVSVAIPVRDGGAPFAGVLAALARQTVAHELVVCDSGSRDGSRELAREHGARVLDIEPARFRHGGTRQWLMEASAGAHVALLSQDAEPADERWLEHLLEGFSLAADVGIAFGPYRPRSDAPAAVRLELERHFRSLAPDGSPRVERLAASERSLPPLSLMGARGFFTDANACIARSAWERVGFRDVPIAEDRVLALDMLRAGYAKAYLPEAAVIHSHHYTPAHQLRRSFDEWRGLLEVYGWREPASPARAAGQLRGVLGHARAELAREGRSRAEIAALLPGIGARHLVSAAGAMLGSRADRLSPRARGLLSLERRESFEPVDWSAAPAQSLGDDRRRL